MRMRIMPGELSGRIDPVIASKSWTHRALIAAALSEEPTILENIAPSADARATCHCLEAMGCRIRQKGEGLEIQPGPPAAGEALMDCGESGTTLRFLLPVAAVMGIRAVFTGRGKLAERPLSPLYEEMTDHGVRMSPQGRFPLRIEGKLTAGEYTLAGNVSSQFFSGLLTALPLADGDSRIRIEGELESAPYVEMTRQMLRRFGVRTEKEDGGFWIPGGQKYHSPGRVTVEGDWSGAAFWLAAGALSRQGVECGGLNMESAQGDRAILGLLREFGARIEEDGFGGVRVSRGTLKGIEIDAADIPDLVPILAVTAAFAEGETVIRHIARLRLKESDRVASVVALIRSLGGTAEAGENEMRIFGGGLNGGVADACNDHRIAMAAAVAGTASWGPVEILGAEAVVKSYPGFFEVYRELGGVAEAVVE